MHLSCSSLVVPPLPKLSFSPKLVLKKCLWFPTAFLFNSMSGSFSINWSHRLPSRASPNYNTLPDDGDATNLSTDSPSVGANCRNTWRSNRIFSSERKWRSSFLANTGCKGIFITRRIGVDKIFENILYLHSCIVQKLWSFLPRVV